MNYEPLVIGVDFGTLSARALILRSSDGKVLSESEFVYPHGVMTERLPDGTVLPADWALQDPEDYVKALEFTIPEALRKGEIDGQQIRGIGIDFTGCTVLPLDCRGTPLCLNPAFSGRPHAWVKLWKHHAAQKQADFLNRLFASEEPSMLDNYGGHISPEIFFSKLLQMADEDPELLEATDRFVEAGDWITQLLCGNIARSESMGVFKCFYDPVKGYPESLMRIPRIAGIIQSKLRGPWIPLGRRCGSLTEEMAARLGLTPGIAVAPAQYDGYAAVPAAGISGPGTASMSVGTSSCLILCHETRKPVRGPVSIGYSGILPDLYGYASGQAAFGDLISWFGKNCVPPRIHETARQKGISVYEELSERVREMRPGQTGLMLLDWWNGSKSLADMNLSGMMIGMTLQTGPEEMYRAILEGLAFGMRSMMDAHIEAGIPVEVFHLAGGIAWKNPLFMQIIADVTGRPLLCTDPVATPAVGAAMFAASAAGIYPDLRDAISAMNCLNGQSYQPDPENHRLYSALYETYRRLERFFGSENPDLMHTLRSFSREVSRP